MDNIEGVKMTPIQNLEELLIIPVVTLSLIVSTLILPGIAQAEDDPQDQCYKLGEKLVSAALSRQDMESIMIESSRTINYLHRAIDFLQKKIKDPSLSEDDSIGWEQDLSEKKEYLECNVSYNVFLAEEYNEVLKDYNAAIVDWNTAGCADEGEESGGMGSYGEPDPFGKNFHSFYALETDY